MVTPDPEVGQRRYVQHLLSPIFPANVTPRPDDILDIEEWDGAGWRHVGEITHAELTGQGD